MTKKAAKKVAKKSRQKKPPKKSAKKVAKKTLKKTAKKAAKKTAKKAAPAKATKSAKSVKKAAKAPVKKAAKKAAPVDLPPVDPGPKRPPKPLPMTAFIRKQHQRLLDLRDELMDAMYGMQQETLKNVSDSNEAAGGGMHTGDAGSDAYDRDFALTLLSKEHDALEEIEAAIQRVEEGRYGICEMSGDKIPHPRLVAIPFARLTVECQAKWEETNGNNRYRPRGEFGFNAPS